jgi:hypothetical protein
LWNQSGVTYVEAEVIAALAVVAVGGALDVASCGSGCCSGQGDERENERRGELHVVAVVILERRSAAVE